MNSPIQLLPFSGAVGNMAKPLNQSDIDLENGTTSGNETSDRSDERVEFAEVITQIEDLPPDGGLKAWLQIVGSYLLYFNTWYVA